METETITFTVTTEPVPLKWDVDGVVRVGGTRVTLDTLIECFVQGATAEEIAQQYPSLHLADVYLVLGYYLRQREQVDAYLARRQRRAEKIRQQNEQRFDPAGVRARLLARQAARKAVP